jgi:HAD superfamily hydrolase (TIGR01459 family)
VSSLATPSKPLIAGLSTIASSYEVILCDIWGVLHNGIEGYRAASDALVKFREQGGRVILVSNAPRPSSDIVGMLDRFSVSRLAYDGIVTSGDVTRAVLLEGQWRSYHWLGPERDGGLFKDLPLPNVDLDQADVIVCTGLHDDDNETAEDYRDFVTKALKRKLPMLCANPDIVVERGNRLIDCAGAIAKLYEDVGGTTLYAGKPHPPIYKAALELASSLTGKAPNAARTLAIGDAIRTDIAGAVTSGFGALFIMNGIHMHELGLSEGSFDNGRFDAFLAKVSHKPDFSIAHLAW